MLSDKKKIFTFLIYIFSFITFIALICGAIFYFRHNKKKSGEEEIADVDQSEYENKYDLFKNKDLIDEAQKIISAYVFYVDNYNYSISIPEDDTSITNEIHKEYQKYENKKLNKELDFLFKFHLKSITLFGVVLFPKKYYYEEFCKDYIKDSNIQQELVNKEMLLTSNNWSVSKTSEPLKKMEEKIKELKININKYNNQGLKIKFTIFLGAAKKSGVWNYKL